MDNDYQSSRPNPTTPYHAPIKFLKTLGGGHFFNPSHNLPETESPTPCFHVSKAEIIDFSNERIINLLKMHL